MQSSKWLICKIAFFYAFLSSARACMTLGDNQYIDMLLAIICILIILPNTWLSVSNTKIISSLFLLIGAAYTMHGSPNITAYLAQIFMVLIPVILIFLRFEYQIDVFKSFSNWYSILLLCSLIFWGLFLLGVPLPHTSQKIEYYYDNYGMMLNNYYLFRETISLNPYILPIEFRRFNGFFLEPGHIGTITSFFLYANGFNMKKRCNIIFLITIILSFSAASYILIILGFLFFKYGTSQKKLKKILLPFILILISIFFISQYNGGKNIINTVIFEKVTRENGAIEGRFSSTTQKTWNTFLSSNDLLWGLGTGANVPNSAGYKVFLINNGLIGVLFVLIAYWGIQKIWASKVGYLMFILYLISFTQRTYCYWDAFLDPFILGIPFLYSMSSKKIENETFKIKKATTQQSRSIR